MGCSKVAKKTIFADYKGRELDVDQEFFYKFRWINFFCRQIRRFPSLPAQIYTHVTPMMLILIKATLSALDSSNQAVTHPCKQTTMSKTLIIFFWASVLAFMCVLGLDSETLTLVQINHKSTFFINSLIQQYSFIPRTNPYGCLKHVFWGGCFFFFSF